MDFTITCPGCGAKILKPMWGAFVGNNPSYYLKQHRKRCDVATDADRKFFREKHHWPKRAKDTV